MEDLLRLSVMLFYRPELLTEYQRLQRELQRAQKDVMGRQSYKKDPLAEFERLYKVWLRYQKKIKEQTFPYEKEVEFKAYEKKVYEEWEREVNMQEDIERKAKEPSAFCGRSSASPPPKKERVAFGSSAK